MNQTIIIQGLPRIEIVFHDTEFEIRNSKKSLVEITKYRDIQKVDFTKGKIPWATGIFTTIIDLVTGHGGLGSWKRGKGQIELHTESDEYIIELKNYDREQTPLAVNLLKEKTYKRQNVGSIPAID